MKELLEKARTIAVVGISSQPEKPAHYVPAYLQRNGYRMIPVNPSLESIWASPPIPTWLDPRASGRGIGLPPCR